MRATDVRKRIDRELAYYAYIKLGRRPYIDQMNMYTPEGNLVRYERFKRYYNTIMERGY